MMVVSQQTNDDYFKYIPKVDLSGIEDDDEILLALLYLMEEFYEKYSTKSPNYILSHIDKDAQKLEKNLLDKFAGRTDEYIERLEYAQLIKYDLTQDLQSKVMLEYDVATTLEVTRSTLKAIIQQFKQDVITKSLVWQDINNEIKEFNIRANYSRATKRIKDAVEYYKGISNQKIARAVQKFVFSDEVLYYWVCLGSNPCAWCIEQSKMSPRKLDEWEFDHINGHCALVPDREVFSDEYKDLVGGLG